MSATEETLRLLRSIDASLQYLVRQAATAHPLTPPHADSLDREAARAGAFVEAYRDLHLKYRGVAYLGNPRTDYEAALQLVAAYDDATAQQLAAVFLNVEDEFVRSGTATVSKFRSRATWCQERLNAEKKRRGIA